MTETPLVTVVVPTRDRWPRSRAAITGALAQEEVDLEVLVVDDGSRDPPAPALRALGDPRLRVLRNEASRGVAAARNQGVHEAHGSWIAFLDDDDLWAPAKLRRQLDAAATEGAGWAYGSAVDIDAGSGTVGLLAPAPDPRRVRRLLLERNVIPGGSSNVLVKADVVRRLGGFDESFLQLADWDLWLRLAAAERAAACDEVLVAYLLHGANMALADPAGVFEELERLAEKHRAESLEAGVELDRVAVARWIAWGQRRTGRRGRAARTYLRAALEQRSPGDVLRAGGALLGERAMRRAARPDAERLTSEPAWIARYT